MVKFPIGLYGVYQYEMLKNGTLKMLSCEKTVIVFLLCLSVMLFSCGDESSNNALDSITKENLSLPKLGLHGSEYRNQRYLFKLLDLPTNNWTIREINNKNTIDAFLDWEEIFGFKVEVNEMDSLLLMEPVIESDFVYQLVDVLENKIPHILIWIEKQTVSDINTPKDYVEGLLETIEFLNEVGALKKNALEVTDQGKILSADRVSGYYYDIIADDGRHSKASLFMRSTSNTFYIYHYDLWAPDQASYEKYLQTFNQMLSTVAFNTQ